MQGHVKLPWGECHSMHLGLPFLPLYKGVKQSVSAQRDFFHSVNQAHAWTFPPKVIMMSLEHHLVMSQ